MPYKDPARQREAMKVIRKRYARSLKGYERRRRNKTPEKRRKDYLRREVGVHKEISRRKVRNLYQALREEQKQQCAYCKVPIRENGGHVDRIVPGVPYSEGNCILACAECNMHKSSSTVDDFLDDMQRQGLIPTTQWTAPGGRYHRLKGGVFKPNPKYKGHLSQDLPSTQGSERE